MSEKIIAYKAMDKNMMCRGKQYEVGKTYPGHGSPSVPPPGGGRTH